MGEKDFDEVEHYSGELVEDGVITSATHQKHSAQGVVLVPQPSDDPRDPLNWSSAKKATTFTIVCFIAFAGLLQALANASGFFYQAAAYGKTPIEISYSLSAAIAGLTVGPFVWTPLATRYGKAAIMFWSMVLTMGTNIWSACMTGKNDYVPFVWSRGFAGLFGSAPLTIGANFIVEIFFLHDRGKCFAIYTFSILIGGICCSTFSGYIVQRVSWTVQFWYNVGLEAVLALLCVLFLDETNWSRPGQLPVPTPPKGLVQRKLATYFFTKPMTAKRSPAELFKSWTLTFRVASCPVSIIVGGNMLVFYGFGIGINTLLSIFLQEPVEDGGYGFSADQNASFTFVLWVGACLAQAYGLFIGDRLPLAICARNRGVWKPEYRLHSTWLPLLVSFPLGVGLFGGSLYYHWHYMVLALGVFLSNFGAISAMSPLLNYVVEALTPAYANEVAAALNFYRTSFALSIPFFLDYWIAAVGVNWAFGMMSIFVVVAYMGIIACMIWGPAIRAKSFVHANPEAGIHILDETSPVGERRGWSLGRREVS
ncbi:uncharacterized protein A1O5_12512 [Cladophialophora psammophila CBS 110553]|uniref:Major facilitator superfamily (MFS) profile domain-containing protein n=1 Tax=Cladophialophora psammophila CBS 110553 TaxID=1182543 RepID=W9VPR6_9EURO|nr:uncharacterized protein A1O5_12512 [Cladophialophora psammophila CBS 110553]EXJ57722.1 hypothetical protein A1O5_12512 [Cladophialophora psammophila CBS 110553]